MKFPAAKTLIKQRLRGIVLILGLIFTYLGITFFSGYFSKAPKSSEDDAFRQFTLSFFQEEAASNALNLHFTLQNPSDYGILDIPDSFGTYSSDAIGAKAAIENCETALETFSYTALSDSNKLTYDILADYLNTSKRGSDFLLYDEPLNATTGIQAQLPVLLAEYRLADEADVQAYLTLLKDMPRYFESLILLEQEKAEKGLFMADAVADTVLKQCRSLLAMDKNHYMYSTFEERIRSIDTLSNAQKQHYIHENQMAIRESFLPAYQSLVTALENLKGNGNELSGVCSLHNGKNYYEYVVSRETGSSRTISDLKNLIQKQMQTDLTSMGLILETSALPALSLQETPEQVLHELEQKISIAFPQPANIKTNVKYVPKAMEPYMSPAFYLIPCIDDTSENTIYINRAHNMDDLKLFTTLAHEGYPGHLYQTTYFTSKNPDPIRTLLNFGGYTEGWATYAEMCSYYLAPLPKKDASLAQKNMSLLLGLYALADIGIHYDGWTVADTIKFFSHYGIDDADTIQEIYELIVSDPANYLKYYVGYVELLELKKEVANRLGDNFSQKEFHKAVLDVGPSPFEIVRKYVLKTCI